MDPFVDQLKRLCTLHPVRAKWVFVPTHAIGRTLGERVALEGTNWLNLRFVTPLDIALRMGAPFLLEVDLGRGIVFRIAGRIDRIDKVGTASFEVIDYKTGGFWPENWKGSFDGGRRLQHALYGLAAVELLKTRYKNPEVGAGVYYFSSHKGRQERVAIPAPAKAAIATVLGDLRDLIINGTFIRTSDEDDCRFCEYIAACGGETNQQAGEKLPDPQLSAYRRLAAHV